MLREKREGGRIRGEDRWVREGRGEVAPLKHQTFRAIVSTVQRRTAENIFRQPLPPPPPPCRPTDSTAWNHG